MTTRSAILRQLATLCALMLLVLLTAALLTGCQSQTNRVTINPRITIPQAAMCQVPPPAPAATRSASAASAKACPSLPGAFVFIINTGGDNAKPIDVANPKTSTALGDTALKTGAAAVGGAGGAALGGPAGAALGAAATTTAASLLTPKPAAAKPASMPPSPAKPTAPVP